MWLDPGIGKLGVKRGLVQPRLLPLLLIHYMVTQLLRGKQMDLGLKTLELDPLLGTLQHWMEQREDLNLYLELDQDQLV